MLPISESLEFMVDQVEILFDEAQYAVSNSNVIELSFSSLEKMNELALGFVSLVLCPRIQTARPTCVLENPNLKLATGRAEAVSTSWPASPQHAPENPEHTIIVWM